MAGTSTLAIQGTVDVEQFWPNGTSDADTTKIKLKISGGAVAIRHAGMRTFTPTRAYQDAVVLTGKNPDGSAKTKPLINSKGEITIRLQRIDAPELHYRPDARGSRGKLAGTGLVQDYRQQQAETATARVGAHLQTFSGDSRVACQFTTELDPAQGPTAAIDKYGRFVGDIVLPDATNLNLWILQQGLAIIALYDSMLPDEINASIASWSTGRRARRGIARYYSDSFVPFDPQLLLRRPPASPKDERSGRFLHPKFYRRQTTWWAFSQVGLFDSDFPAWLEKRAERCHYLPEFQQLGKRAGKYFLYERATDGDGLSWAPEDFIFEESPSSIFRANRRGELDKVKLW